MISSAEFMLQFILSATLWYLVTVNWARAQTDNLKNVNFRNISPIQNVNMAESCITPCRSPNGNLTCGNKCYLLHTMHFYLHKPGLQSWVSLVFSVSSTPTHTHSHYFTLSHMLDFWNSMFPTSQTCLCLNPQSDFPEGAELLAYSVPVSTLTSRAGPVNSRSVEWNDRCREPNTQTIRILLPYCTPPSQGLRTGYSLAVEGHY